MSGFFILLTAAAFLQAMIAGAILTPVARALAPKLGMMDAPTLDRKIHQTIIPRAGGLAIYAAFWGSILIDAVIAAKIVPGLEWVPENVRVLAANVPSKLAQLGGIAGGCTIIFLLGLADDIWNLPAKLRLGVQFLAVIPLIATGVSVQFFLPVWAGWLVTAFWVVLLTNSFNFMDNMNGLTSGVAAIIAAVMVLQSYLAGEYYMMLVFAMLAGAAKGFWFYNFPKASIFLGDSGSTHLGFLFGALTIVSTYYHSGVQTQLPVLMPMIVLGVPLFDTVSVMWIRWRTGKPFMEGDTNHFSHRMVALGMSRTEAVVFIYGVTLCVGLAAVVLRPLDWRYGLVQAAVIGMLFLAIYWMERVSRHQRKNT